MIHLERIGLGLAILATMYSIAKGVMWADKRYPGTAFVVADIFAWIVKGFYLLIAAYIIGWFLFPFSGFTNG